MIQIEYKIVNIVLSGKLHQTIPFQKMVDSCPNFLYDPEDYCGAHLKLSMSSVTLYHSGNYILVGIDNVSSIDDAVNEFFTLMSNYADVNLFEKPKIVNIVSVGSVTPKIDIIDFYNKYSKIYDMKYCKMGYSYCINWKINGIFLRIFQSGKLFLAGSRDMKFVEDTWNKINSIFKEFNNTMQ